MWSIRAASTCRHAGFSLVCAAVIALAGSEANAAPPAASEAPDPALSPEPEPQSAPTEDEELDASADFGDLLGTEIVSTASRTAEDAATAPATLTVITSEELTLLGITTLADAINYFGLGMTVQQDGGQEGSMTVTARGVGVTGDGGNHVLMLLNGHALNDVWGGWNYVDDLNSIPVEAIDHIEILNGPGSVLYGSSAMYGVINIVTKDAEAQKGLGVTIQGHTALPGDGNNNLIGPSGPNKLGWGSRARIGFAHPFAVGDKDGEFFIQLQRVDRTRPTHVYGPQAPDWDPGPIAYPNGDWGGIVNSKRATTSGMVGFRLGGWAVDLSGGFWRRTHTQDYQADLGDPRNIETYGETHLDLRNATTLRQGMQLRSRIYGDYWNYRGSWIYTEPDYCGSGLEDRCDSYERTNMGRLGAEEVLEVDWFVDGKVVTTFGGDVRGRAVRDWAAQSDYTTGFEPEGRFLDYLAVTAAGALFIQQRYKPVRWFGLNVGLRLDMDQLFGVHLSPRAVTTFIPVDGTVLKLIYSEAFRAPLAGELLFKDPTYAVAAKSFGGLEPEVTRSGEFAVEQRLPRGIGAVRLGSYISWYLNLVGVRSLTTAEYTDAVEDGRLNGDVDPNYAATYANIGRIFGYGGYFGARLQTPQRKFRFNTNVQAGDSTLTQVLDGDAYTSKVPIAPQVAANANATLAWGGAIPNLSLGVFYNSPRRGVQDTDGEFADITPNRAGQHVQGRLAITGKIAKAGLSWGVWSDYTIARRGPYFIGQLNYSDGMSFPGELTPLDRLSIWAGLTWQFDVVAAAKRPGKSSGVKASP